MVDAVEAREPGHLVIRMLLDDPVCLYVAQIHHQIKQAVLGVEGIDRVDVEFSGEAIWTQERATELTRRKIERRREQLRRLIVDRQQSSTTENRRMLA
jgi:metal-sulfur cluster biosynthetic enzyme